MSYDGVNVRGVFCKVAQAGRLDVWMAGRQDGWEAGLLDAGASKAACGVYPRDLAGKTKLVTLSK